MKIYPQSTIINRAPIINYPPHTPAAATAAAATAPAPAAASAASSQQPAASFRALFTALVKYMQRGGGLRPPPFGYIVENAANNPLNDAAGCWLLAAGC